MADKQELWLARNNRRNSRIEIHCGKPSLDKDNTMNHETFVAWVDDFSFPLPEGHIAPLTIGEAVDCRPKPVNVPEIWLYRLNRAWFYGNKHEQMMSIKEPEGVELPIKHKCRIAIDESGIRLIGTPERV